MAWLNTPKSTWIALVFAVGLIAATWYPGLDERFHQDPAVKKAAVGDTANLSFTLKDLVSGRDVSLSSYRGKVIILNFFATWCGPCRAIAPHIEALSLKHPDIKFFKVDVDENEEAAKHRPEAGNKAQQDEDAAIEPLGHLRVALAKTGRTTEGVPR
mgnify:CR=1 FL=1